MADNTQKLDFTRSVARLEEINSWFQKEDINLDQGLEMFKEGIDLIKRCKGRLSEVENEFVKIKSEFTHDESEEESDNEGETNNHQIDKDSVSPDDIPF